MVMPSDTELTDAVKEMLVGANLEELTVKKIRTALQEKFDADLASKKVSASSFICYVLLLATLRGIRCLIMALRSS
jgi:DEK C terminal domain